MTTPTGMQNSLSIAERRRLRQQEQEAARAKQAAAEQGITGPPDAARMDLSKIIRNPENPRDDLSEVEELAASIREVGVTQAITLIPASTFVAAYPEHAETVNGFPYVVVNGNRRHRASELAEETDIPFTVNTRATTRVDIATVALVENVHRVDLTPMEEARTVAELKEVYGRAALVAKRLSKSEGWVSQRLKLMNLTDEFQSEVESGKLLVEDARVLGRAKPEDQPVVREDFVPSARRRRRLPLGRPRPRPRQSPSLSRSCPRSRSRPMEAWRLPPTPETPACSRTRRRHLHAAQPASSWSAPVTKATTPRPSSWRPCFAPSRRQRHRLWPASGFRKKTTPPTARTSLSCCPARTTPRSAHSSAGPGPRAL